jgi:hypothetical protein
MIKLAVSLTKEGPLMTEQPKLEMVSDGTDIFLNLDGKRIAKRGRPKTPHAKQGSLWNPASLYANARLSLTLSLRSMACPSTDEKAPKFGP